MSALKTPDDDAPAAEWGALAVSIPGWRGPDLPPDCDVPALWDAASAQPVPDPDHWAWEGWLLRLLGTHPPIWSQAPHCVGIWTPRIHRPQPYMGSLGRACIATAAALGRWPGGDS